MKVWTARYPVEFFAGVGGIVLILWLFSPIYMRVFFGEAAGSKGDSFGALTSLFTGAAFVGLIATLMQQQREIRMQRQDLKLQREEMKASRAELSGQKEQMELQNQSLKQQMFEQTFFNLLNVFNQYISDLVQNEPFAEKEPKRGRDQLEAILNQILNFSRSVDTGLGPLSRLKDRDRLRVMTAEEIFEAAAQRTAEGMLEHRNDLSSYFRLLYNILKLVDQSDVDDKTIYTNILRAQLSDSELQLVALNCALREGTKLQVYVDRYGMLKHLPPKWRDLEIQAVCEEIQRQKAEEKASA